MTPTRMISLRLPHAVVKQLDRTAGTLKTTRTTVIESAIESLQLVCPTGRCDFAATSAAATCPVHNRRVVLPQKKARDLQ